jgi:dienelactone hydrolase
MATAHDDDCEWDGINDVEKRRASMLAQDFGYVGFAADIYGADSHNGEVEEQRGELASLYRDNSTHFAERIRAAVDLVQTFDEVDPDQVAMIGYCFGRMGVLT